MTIDKLKIAIVVHGRFYAFDLARELITQGHNVTVFTNYPTFICKKFGIPPRCVRSFLLHGILTRVADRLRIGQFEPYLHIAFSKWAAKELRAENWDVIKAFSGVAAEIFLEHRNTRAIKILVRASAHIRIQSQLLEDEEKRARTKLERPSSWMILREEGEYRLADFILVVSDFCLKSFVDMGFDKNRLILLNLGVNVGKFRPNRAAVDKRRERLHANERMRVLTVGTFSFQKGALDLCQIASAARGKFTFRFVGSVAPEARQLVKKYAGVITFIPKIDESQLPEHYEWADVFVFPTIQDGYPAVLAQALASGLPILTTTNCSGLEMTRQGKMGWVMPIREPRAFLSRLQWCDSHRSDLERMVGYIYENYSSLDFREVALRFVSICSQIINTRRRAATP